MSNEVFAENLSYLLSTAKLSKKKAAEKLKIGYPWLRRAGTEGVGRPDPRNHEILDKISNYFCLQSNTDLWLNDLRHKLMESNEYQDFRKKFLGGRPPIRQPSDTGSQLDLNQTLSQLNEKLLQSLVGLPGDNRSDSIDRRNPEQHVTPSEGTDQHVVQQQKSNMRDFEQLASDIERSSNVQLLRNAIYAHRVLLLLCTGQHEYLKKLIDDLLRLHLQSPPNAPSKTSDTNSPGHHEGTPS